MPHYKVPPEESFEAGGNNKKQQPTVFVPMDPKQLDKLRVGEVIEVTLKGKLVGFSARERDGKQARGDMDIAVTDVNMAYPGNKEMEELADS